MELIKKVNSKSRRCDMISEVQAGQGFASLSQAENACLAKDLPEEIIANKNKKFCK